MSASTKIARFIAGFDPDRLSAQSRHTIQRAYYDTIVVALAAAAEPATRAVMAYASSQVSAQIPAGQGGTVWSDGSRLPTEFAALVNGTAAHALDYDDVASPLRGHPSAAMVPALLALGEATQASGHRLIDAYAVGFEVSVRIGRAVVDDHYAKGWHSTSSIATLGTTAACAWLLGLDETQTAHALGIALSQIAGTRENFGTMTKSLQAGLANAAAVRSVVLARAGLDASPFALDGPHGYSVLYCDGHDLHPQLDDFTTLPLEIQRSGIEIKKYPLCYATHRALDGILELSALHHLQLSEVDRVEVRTNYRGMVQLIHHSPRTGLEAKFSMEFAVATALCDGHVSLGSFEDAAVLRPEIQSFFSKVSVSEGAPPLFPRWTELSLHMHDGRTFHRSITLLRGSADHPLTDAELVAKGDDCCRFGQAPFSGHELAGLFFHMDDIDVELLLKPMAR